MLLSLSLQKVAILPVPVVVLFSNFYTRTPVLGAKGINISSPTAAVVDKPTNDNAVGNGVSNFQQTEDRIANKSETSNMVLDNSSPDAVEKRSTPLLLSQLGSLISPSPKQIKDPTVQSKEISEKKSIGMS
jgi:hypothetical protein